MPVSQDNPELKPPNNFWCSSLQCSRMYYAGPAWAECVRAGAGSTGGNTWCGRTWHLSRTFALHRAPSRHPLLAALRTGWAKGCRWAAVAVLPDANAMRGLQVLHLDLSVNLRVPAGLLD